MNIQRKTRWTLTVCNFRTVAKLLVNWNIYFIHTEPIFGGMPIFRSALAANAQFNKFESKVSNQGIWPTFEGLLIFGSIIFSLVFDVWSGSESNAITGARRKELMEVLREELVQMKSTSVSCVQEDFRSRLFGCGKSCMHKYKHDHHNISALISVSRKLQHSHWHKSQVRVSSNVT